MEILHISDLSFSYPETDTPALQDVSFSVSAGEFVVICGESGCGKTTLLKLLKPALAPAGRAQRHTRILRQRPIRLG